MLGKCRLDGHWAIFSDLPMSGKDKCHVKEIILVSVFACEEKVSHHGRWNKYFLSFQSVSVKLYNKAIFHFGSFASRPKRPCKLNAKLDNRNVFRTLSTYMMEIFKDFS